MIWTLEPYVGVGPLRFGIGRREVEAVLGAPTLESLGETLVYPEVLVHLRGEGERVEEIGFVRTAHLVVDGVDVFHEPAALRTLAARDGAPMESVGSVVLFTFGVSLTGMEDDDPSDRAATVFARGAWDALRPRMRPLILARR